MKNIAFLGLGVMGNNIASHIVKKFGKISIFNRNIKKSHEFKSKFKNFDVIIAEEPEDLVNDNQIFISCVGNDLSLNEIFFSKKGIYNNLRKNSFIIDHTTVAPDTAISCLKKFKLKKSYFLDAPVSGGEIGAKEGKLSIMVGGEKKKLKDVEKIISLYSKSIIYMGKSGNGQLAKMVNQICVSGILQGLAEGLNFAKLVGLNYENLFSAISKGAAQSWQMDNRSQTMWSNKFNFGFMNKWMKKDLDIAIDVAKNKNINLDNTKKILENYEILIKKGDEKLDTSSLIKLLNKN